MRAVAFIASTLASLLICEALLRVVRPGRFGIDHLPPIYEADEELGYHYIPHGSGFKRRNSEIVNRVQINSQGFRDKERPHKKESHVTRIAVVGDSFVVGFEVPFQETYPSVRGYRLMATAVADLVSRENSKKK